MMAFKGGENTDAERNPRCKPEMLQHSEVWKKESSRGDDRNREELLVTLKILFH